MQVRFLPRLQNQPSGLIFSLEEEFEVREATRTLPLNCCELRTLTPTALYFSVTTGVFLPEDLDPLRGSWNMFPFEKLTVYKKSKIFYKKVLQWLKTNPKVDRVIANQLKRAALSVPLNIAEGASRYTKPDQRNFYTISRSSVFECVAIFDLLKDACKMDWNAFEFFYQLSDELSRMLFSMAQLKVFFLVRSHALYTKLRNSHSGLFSFSSYLGNCII